MRYVIIRDDDTNALTPIDCLERLYRPLLDRGWPINLATIPAVAKNARMVDGKQEGFLPAGNGVDEPGDATVPIASNQSLVSYLLENRNYRIVQHGCHHHYLEFDNSSQEEVSRRLDLGGKLLCEAGFPQPETFVAPYDKLSKTSLREVAKRFQVLSTGWFELRRLPWEWRPRYALKKLFSSPHWRVGSTLLLTHPGCLLSFTRSFNGLLDVIMNQIESTQVTVLVTHWWEYFRNGKPDEPFIDFLHETAEHISKQSDIKVIAFSDLTSGSVRLN